MAKKSSLSSTVLARHLPSGENIESARVTDLLKPGPWKCPVESCGLDLVHVYRRPSYREGKKPRNATSYFRRAKNFSEHKPECAAAVGRTASRGRYDPGLRAWVRKQDTFLLSLGSKPAPEQPNPDGTAGGTGSRSAQDTYAGRVNNLESWLRTIERVGGEEDMRLYFHRHNGVNYRWDDIAYEAEYAAYTRLFNTVELLVNPAPDRPWLIRGVSQSAIKKTRFQEDRYFILLGANETAPVPKVRAFFTMTPELKTATQSIQSGVPVALLLTRGEPASGGATGFSGDLNSAADLALLP